MALTVLLTSKRSATDRPTDGGTRRWLCSVASVNSCWPVSGCQTLSSLAPCHYLSVLSILLVCNYPFQLVGPLCTVGSILARLFYRLHSIGPLVRICLLLRLRHICRAAPRLFVSVSVPVITAECLPPSSPKSHRRSRRRGSEFKWHVKCPATARQNQHSAER